MGFQKLTTKRATSLTPQVVTLIVDDSGSMSNDGKATQATEAMRDLLITMQAGSQGAGGFRFLLNVAKFGSNTTPLAEAARPEAIALDQLAFTGDSGGTEMVGALSWAAGAVKAALAECKRIPGYKEESSPNPLVFFFSDGKNESGGDVRPAADALRKLPFAGGAVDVVAIGIGLDPADFPLMEQIASRPDLAVNIDPSQLAEFIADVGATVQKGESPSLLVDRFN
jgi:uncharacterized protein YegL